MVSGHFHGLFIPITWLTWALDYLIWGMNPLGYHLGNLFFHTLNAFLLYRVACTLFRRLRPDADPDRILWAAVLGAALYALHPLRVESVAWLTERRDSLSGTFFLLTILSYLRMTEQPPGTRIRRVWLALSVICFLTMILSKPMAMALPLVLLLIDAYPLGRFSREKTRALLLEKLPFVPLMIFAVAITGIGEREAGAMYSRADYPWMQSLAQPGYRIPFYLGKMFLPIDLSPLYWYRPELGLRHLLGWIGLVAVTVALLVQRRRYPALLAAWVCYGLLISPVCGLVQVGPNFAADKYSYYAAMPVSLFAAGLLLLAPSAALFRGLTAAALVVALGLAGLSARQGRFWVDSVALWNRVIELDPDVYFSRNRRAQALAARGEWGRARIDYDRSIELNAGWYESWASRARAKAAQGDVPGAIADATRALELHPQFADAFHTRGLAFARIGKLGEALRDYSKALELQPKYVEARVDRAQARALAGDFPGALADFDEALKIEAQPSVYVRRATLRALKGDLDGAIADCSEALRLKPGYVDAYVRRGMARAEKGDPKGAGEDFAKALELAPPNWPQRKSVEALLQRTRPDMK